MYNTKMFGKKRKHYNQQGCDPTGGDVDGNPTACKYTNPKEAKEAKKYIFAGRSRPKSLNTFSSGDVLEY